MKKNVICFLVSSLLILCIPFFAISRDYPAKPIKFIIPWASGGATTFLAHALAENLKSIIKESVVVQNMPGAQGTVGTHFVATSKPDGYTLALVPIGPIVTQPIFEKTPYVHTDLEVVCQFSYLPLFLVCGSHTPYKNIQELIEFAKKNPEKVVYHHPGDRTVPYFSLKAFATANGIKIVKTVPYPGMAAGVKDMLGGHVDVGLASIGDIAPYLESDKIRIIGFFSEKRWEELPNIPSFEELGVKTLPKIWNGVFAPKGTPKQVLDILEKSIQEAVFSKGFQEAMKKLKQPIEFLSREDFKKRIEEDVKFFQRMKEESK